MKMKMKKKICLIILFMTSLFACIFGLTACRSDNGNNTDSESNTEQDGDTDNSETYKPTDGLVYTDKGSFYEVKNIGTANDTEVLIAKTYNGKPVTSIGQSAFSFTNIKSVTIPDSITRINNWAFANSSLTNITIPDSVISIEYGAFNYCESLKSVTIGKGVTSIGINVFSNCSSLNNVTIKSGLKSIGDGMFQDCKSLTSVTIPNGVTSIGILAFSGCSSLTSISIPGSVKSIETSAFYGCNNLTVYFGGSEQDWNEIFIDEGNNDLINASRHYNSSGIENGNNGNDSESNSKPTYQAHTLTYDLNYDGASTIAQQVVKNENVNLIKPERAGYQFSGWYYNGIKIESGIWQYDSDITLTARWEAINYTITYNTDSGLMPDDCLKSFTVSSYNLPYTLPIPTKQGLNFTGWYENAEFSGEPITEIPKNSLRNYVLYAKYTDEQLLEFELSFDETYYSVIGYKGKPQFINVPEEIDGLPVKEIAVKAFENCSTLKNITFSENICQINNSAFSGCSLLTSISIPDGVTSIGGNAFNGCRSLTSITIPDSVTSIGDNAFYDCRSLTSITIPDGVTYIGGGTFSGCSSLTSVSIPDSVMSIGNYAFEGCSSLTSITIPDGVTAIGSWTFNHCQSLKSITIPDGVTTIGEYAFYDCDSLTSITIPDGVTSIANYAFYDCDNLTSISLPDSVIDIGKFPENLCKRYADCYYIPTKGSEYGILYKVLSTDITNVNIHIGCKTINRSAFYKCSSLTSITIPDGVKIIGSYAFQSCRSLTSITIPDGVTTIGEYAFYDCDSLTSIILPDGVTSIGDSAFSGCDSLTSVYFKGTADDWSSVKKDNSYITYNATLYYFKATEPADDGNYWHYDADGKTPVIWKKEN